MKSCLSKPEMFCPLLIYSKLGWKTCTFIPNKHHFRRWLISEITIFHQQFIRIKIDLICKTNFWTLPMRKITSKLRGIKVLKVRVMETMKDSLKSVGYVFMEIPPGILLADIFARTTYIGKVPCKITISLWCCGNIFLSG